MFFKKKPCASCESNLVEMKRMQEQMALGKAEISRLNKLLDILRIENNRLSASTPPEDQVIDAPEINVDLDNEQKRRKASLEQPQDLKGNVAIIPDAEIVGTVYFNRNLDWHTMELSEIEKEIKNIYDKFGHNTESISAVNELQAIQREIIQRKKKKKPESIKISKLLLSKSIKVIVNSNISSFCKVVQNGTSDWASGNISRDDEEKIMSLIGRNVRYFLAFHNREVLAEINAHSFGSLLTGDKRSFVQFVKSELPKVLIEIEKEALKTKKVDLQLAKKKEIKRELWKQHKPEILEVLNEHKPKLLSNLRKSYQIDEYGAIKKDDRNEEIHRFLKSVKLIQKSRKIGLSKVQGLIKTWATNEIRKTSISTPLPEDGIDFEYWVADRLREYDWEAQVTQGSGDQGVDVIAGQGNLRIAVQCKLYQGSVGNKAVQETLSGMLFFDLDRGVVISTGKYTRSAQELADKNKILLLSPQDIPSVLELLQS